MLGDLGPLGQVLGGVEPLALCPEQGPILYNTQFENTAPREVQHGIILGTGRRWHCERYFAK